MTGAQAGNLSLAFLGSRTNGSEGCLGPISPKRGLAQPSQSHLTVAVQRPPSQVHPGGPECTDYASEGGGEHAWTWESFRPASSETLGQTLGLCGTPFLIYKMGDM